MRRSRDPPEGDRHRAHAVRARHNRLDVVDRAERVRDVDDADELGRERKLAVHRVEVEAAVVGDRHVAQLGAPLLGQELPRHDVGVVLHLGEHDPIPGADVGAAPRVGDQVDRLGDVLREHHLLVVGVDPVGDRPAGALERRRRLLRKRVDPAVDVRVVLGQRGVESVEHRLGLLRGGRAVQVGERLALDPPREDRELRRDARDVERSDGCGGGGFHRQAAASTSSRIQP